MSLALAFALGDGIDMCTSDGRTVAMRVSKVNERDEPALDLLPQVRYRVRVTPAAARQDWNQPNLFSQGVLCIPDFGADGLVSSVCLVNIGSRVCRLSSGTQVLCAP